MSGKLAVAISDLHLGRGNRQDSFTKEHPFVTKFGEDLAAARRNTGVDLTVILNGDVVDLWELVSDAELERGEAAWQAITSGLHVPVRTPDDLARLLRGMEARLTETLAYHVEFTGFLETMLKSGIKVHVNVGNHDHQLDQAEGARMLASRLRAQGVPSLTAGNFTVGRWYLDKDLGFYAEHGDQFAGEESRSPLLDPTQPALEEAGGFYVLRYVWNRLENEGLSWVQHPTIAQVLRELVRLLGSGRDGPIDRALEYLNDYFKAVRSGAVPAIVDIGIIKALYKLWKPKPQPRLTRTDLEAVTMLESAPGELEIQEALVEEELLESAPAAAAPGWLPGADFIPQPGKADKYARGLRERFSRASGGFPHLDKATFRTVSIGHTHREGQWDLLGDRAVTYLNTGSWTVGHPMLFAFCYRAPGQASVAGLRQL